jgi:hypothetical protein
MYRYLLRTVPYVRTRQTTILVPLVEGSGRTDPQASPRSGGQKSESGVLHIHARHAFTYVYVRE